MQLCFFTMSNSKRMSWARRLVCSGAVVGRPIWFYRILDSHPDPKRFKCELLIGDQLPEADKYIYLDSDVLMLQHGDWESPECVGAVSEQRFRIRARHYFSSGSDCEQYLRLLKECDSPERVNTGCVVLPADIRKQVGERWRYWCERVEEMCERPMKMRDQPQFPFVMKEFNIPILPGRFCAIVKREPVTESHIALHASGHPSGNSLKQYTDAVQRLLGGDINEANTQKDLRWQVLTDLIMRYAENSAYPVGVEVGVFKGGNASRLLNAFPGLRLHCVDNRRPPGAERRHSDTLEVWDNVKSKYDNRITDYVCNSNEANIPEPLDFAFIDADHRTEAVAEDIKHYYHMVKPGGFIAGHDIDYKGTYYSVDSVRKAVTACFGKNFRVGPDHTWWSIKSTQNNLSS